MNKLSIEMTCSPLFADAMVFESLALDNTRFGMSGLAARNVYAPLILEGMLLPVAFFFLSFNFLNKGRMFRRH